MTSPAAIRLFEELAAGTWDRIKYGEELRCRQGEETITDINLLELKRANLSSVAVDKVDKQRERDTGLDWEWWIGSNSEGWWRYAVQAKRISASGRYRSLRHHIGARFQIDLLETYANANRCIPLYCFYNYLPLQNGAQYWHCPLPYEESQFGCTVVPLDSVRIAFPQREPKTFEALHEHRSARPWRCVVKCPEINRARTGVDHPLASVANGSIERHPSAPTWLVSEGEDVEGVALPPEFYNREIEIYPKRIMFVDTGQGAG